MGRLLCLVRRHAWIRQRNPELGGAAAQFDVCRRCGKERGEYGPRSGETMISPG